VGANGYKAAYCPVSPEADGDTIRAFAQAALRADIVIAEVGAWSNPLSPDAEIRRAALDKCIAGLALSEKIDARCCVNIAGSRGVKWDGPHRDDLTPETFDMIVETARHIIDTVQPTRTYYTLEPMPWMYPDSCESYLELMRAIDREAFGVHLDPVNMISSPGRYFNNGAFVRDCIKRLGPYIRSCHAKDVVLRDQLTVHLDEVRPGLGGLDYRSFLHALDALDPDMPLMLEHLTEEGDYHLAAQYVRAIAEQEGLNL
jgi:sugar phosphate isomerase/epimerase